MKLEDGLQIVVFMFGILTPLAGVLWFARKQILIKVGDMIGSCETELKHGEELNSNDIAAAKDKLERLSRDMRKMENQLMTEGKVESKLQPIKDDIKDVREEVTKVKDELGGAIRELKQDFKDRATVSDKNTQNVLSRLAEMNGYLRAKSEDGGL